jgi:hypothetical protein
MLSSLNACLIVARVSRRTLSEICIKFGAVILSGASRNRIRPDTQLQMKGRKKSACLPTQLREILYTDSQNMLVLSSDVAPRYYSYRTDGSISPGNYG